MPAFALTSRCATTLATLPLHCPCAVMPRCLGCSSTCSYVLLPALQVKRKHGDAGVTYSMEVSMDYARPGCVLHWAVNDWTLPPRVGLQTGAARLHGSGLAGVLRSHMLCTACDRCRRPCLAGLPAIAGQCPSALLPLRVVNARAGATTHALQEAWPAGTNQAGDKAVQTPLADGRHLTITFPEVRTAEGAAEIASGTGQPQDAASDRCHCRTCGSGTAEALVVLACAAAARGAALSHSPACHRLSQPALPLLSLPVLLSTPPPPSLRPQATCPQRIVFVLKEGEQWSNSGGGDFVAHLKPPGAEGGSWLGQALLNP